MARKASFTLLTNEKSQFLHNYFKKTLTEKKGTQVTQKKSDDAKSTIVTCKPDLNIYCKDFFSCQSNLQYFLL